MRNPLRKRIFRMLGQAPGNYIPVFVLMTLTIVFISAFFITQGSVKHLYYENLKHTKLEDGQITAIAPLDQSTVNRIERLGVDIYENFYIEKSIEEFTPENTQKNIQENLNEERSLRIYKNREHINLATFSEGMQPVREDEIAIAGITADANNLSVGDVIEVDGRPFKITGTFSVPDYTAILRNRTDLFVDPVFFGLGLVSEEGFQRFGSNGIKYCYSYHTADELSKDEAFDKLKEIYRIASESAIISDSVTAFDNNAMNYLMNDMGGDVPMITTLLVLILFSLSFLFTVQAKSMIEEEAPVIGTLLASGYTSAEIMKHYLLLPMLVTSSAAVIGNILTYSGLYRIFADMYYQFFSLPPFQPVFNPGAFLVTTLIPLFVIFFVNYLMLSLKFRISPLRFLRRELSRRKKRSRIHLALPFMKAFRIRVLMDHKVNLFALFFGLFIANILLVFGLSFQPLMDEFSEDMMNEMPYRYTYLLRYPYEVRGEREVHKGLIVKMDTYFHSGGAKSMKDTQSGGSGGESEEAESISYYGLSKGTKYQNLGNIDELKEGEVIVSGGFLNKHGLKIGDRFAFAKPYSDKLYVSTVSGQIPEVKSIVVFMPIEELNRAFEIDGGFGGEFEDGFFNAYFSDKQIDFDDGILLTTINRETVGKSMEHLLSGFDRASLVVSIVSVSFYFMFMYVLGKLIIDRSKVNISYLKIFGFNTSEIASIYINSIRNAVFVYLILIVPLLDFLGKKLITLSLLKFDYYIEVSIPCRVYALAVVLGFALYVSVQFLQTRKISKMNMVEGLKNTKG